MTGGRLLLQVGRAVLLFVVVTFVAYLAVHAQASPSSYPERAAGYERAGLDRSVVGGYAHWLAGAFQGDFGLFEWAEAEPASGGNRTASLGTVLREHGEASLERLALGVSAALVVGFGLSWWTRLRRSRAMAGAALLASSVPVFVVGVLVLVWSIDATPSDWTWTFGWLPFGQLDGISQVTTNGPTAWVTVVAFGWVAGSGVYLASRRADAATIGDRVRLCLRNAPWAVPVLLSAEMLLEIVVGPYGLGSVLISSLYSADLVAVLGVVFVTALLGTLVAGVCGVVSEVASDRAVTPIDIVVPDDPTEHEGQVVPRDRARRVAALLAGAWLALIVVGGLGASAFSADPYDQSLRSMFEGPSFAHPVGTDFLGRDNFARLLHGAGHLVTTVGPPALATAAVVVGLRMLANRLGRHADGALRFIRDAAAVLPAIVLFGALGVGEQPPLGWELPVAILLVSLPVVLRVVPAGQGARPAVRWMWTAAGAAATSAAVGAFLVFAVDYVGLGAQPPEAGWGTTVREHFGYALDRPIAIYAAAMAMGLTVAAFRILAEFAFDRGRPTADSEPVGAVVD